MKDTSYESKVNTRDELLQRTFDATGCVNKVAVLP
jgi:hypothetical protein